MLDASEVVESLPTWKRGLFASTIVILPIVALIALEAGSRVFFRVMYGVPGKRYGIWRTDPELGAIHKESAYNSMGETNNRGFRNRDDVYDPKPPGSLRLIIYGGSTTFCSQILTDEAWPARLEQALRSRRPGGQKDQVLNGGAVMWSIGHIYARAKRDVPTLKPDYVLIYSGVNETPNDFLLRRDGIALEDLVKEGRFGVYSKNLDQANWIKRELFSFKLYHRSLSPGIHKLLEWVRNSPDQLPSGPIPHVLENYLHVLGDLIQLVRANGGVPVFVVEITGDPTPYNSFLTSYSRSGARLAAEMGAIVIDPSPILEGNPEGPQSLFESTGIHYSESGARKMAIFLYDNIFKEPDPRAN